MREAREPAPPCSPLTLCTPTTGIAVEPDNRSLQDKLQEARASIRPVQPQSGSGLLLGTPAARLRTAHAALRAFVVANALLYVLPVLGSTAAARCYSSALMGTVVSMLWAAVAQHGAPRMDKQVRFRPCSQRSHPRAVC